MGKTKALGTMQSTGHIPAVSKALRTMLVNSPFSTNGDNCNALVSP